MLQHIYCTDDVSSGRNGFLVSLYFCIICWELQLKLWLIHILPATKSTSRMWQIIESSQQHRTLSPTSQQDEQSTRVYGTAIPRMVEPQSAESRNECHFQVQIFSQHRHSLHSLCPRRMRYLFLYSYIANFQSPCPNLLISVDKRPGGLSAAYLVMTKDKKKLFSSQTNPAPVPKHPEDKTILSFHITMLQRNKHRQNFIFIVY